MLNEAFSCVFTMEVFAVLHPRAERLELHPGFRNANMRVIGSSLLDYLSKDEYEHAFCVLFMAEREIFTGSYQDRQSSQPRLWKEHYLWLTKRLAGVRHSFTNTIHLIIVTPIIEILTVIIIIRSDKKALCEI